MFKYWKENRDNKRDILLYKAFLLRTVSEIVLEYKKSQDAVKQSGMTEKDVVDIMAKLKGVDQKDLVSKIVESIKPTENSGK